MLPTIAIIVCIVLFFIAVLSDNDSLGAVSAIVFIMSIIWLGNSQDTKEQQLHKKPMLDSAEYYYKLRLVGTNISTVQSFKFPSSVQEPYKIGDTIQYSRPYVISGVQVTEETRGIIISKLN